MEDPRFGHFTSTAGLLGIMEREVLWATNIKFLNDEHEFQHALDMIKEIIPTSKIGTDDPAHALHQEFLAKVLKKIDSLDSYEFETIFTFSFSEQTDLLSQWRGYCPNNNGYCVVFDAKALHEELNKSVDECHLVKCVYDDVHKGTELRKALNEAWHRYRQLSEKKERQTLIDDFGKQVMIFASYFKHPSFKEEQEHRIVVLGEYGALPDTLKFRTGRSSLIPYLELPAPRRLIKEVCIGPTVNKPLAKRALQALVEKTFGFPVFLVDFGVTFSKTPYRPW